MKIIKKLRTLYASLLSINNEIVRNSRINFYKNLFLTSKEFGVSSEPIADREVVVSLTTYGLKITQVYLAIESLLHQTMKPNKIILWLDENKYSNENSIPIALQRQLQRGLEIRLCKDVRSHTKLVPALINYPEAIIITIDDDIIYPIDFVERLVRSYQNDRSKIYYYRGHQITFDDTFSYTPSKYIDWVKKGGKGSSILNVPTGVLGILYPPHCLHKDATDADKFLTLCPLADDIWFKIMSLLNGIECEEVPTIHRENQFISLDIDETTSLQSRNVVGGKNDEQIAALFRHYPLRDIFMEKLGTR